METTPREKGGMTVYGKYSSRMQDDASCHTVCISYIIYDVTRECVANNELPTLRTYVSKQAHRNFDIRTLLYDEITKVKRKFCQR